MVEGNAAKNAQPLSSRPIECHSRLDRESPVEEINETSTFDRNFEPLKALPQEQARLLVACDFGGIVLAFAHEPVDGKR